MKQSSGPSLKVNGLIGYYRLNNWWFETFTEKERKFIDERYHPVGQPPHSLTQGEPSYGTIPVTTFLNSLSTWFQGQNETSINGRIHKKVVELGKSQPISEPGFAEGRHFSTFVNDIKDLNKSKEVNEEERILLEMVNATEAESKAKNWGVAPWYYERLAILYKKQKKFDKEIEILERFARQKHAPGAKPLKLLARLAKAREKF